ncbi:Protein kinase C iota type [Heterocephalus glaber]|uniref:Protein kinase C iota type n=1 Tax=Heterocephalus glaber TaxID=10181 RepID=G5BHD2_HETGA|nr:Protein kinase C iota type [Heterocephalus glaber]
MYAVKAVKKEHVNIDWIQKEKYILEQAFNCPFLVGLYACFQTESRFFLLLDYVNGGDLLFHTQQQRQLPEEHARFYSAEISLADNYLHQQGILYRILKLENILLNSEGHIKLINSCLCKEDLQPGDMTRTFCGTPNFMAPELIRREDYSFSVDWWNLGVIVYIMMIRESPFDLDDSTDNPYENSIEHVLQGLGRTWTGLKDHGIQTACPGDRSRTLCATACKLEKQGHISCRNRELPGLLFLAGFKAQLPIATSGHLCESMNTSESKATAKPNLVHFWFLLSISPKILTNLGFSVPGSLMGKCSGPGLAENITIKAPYRFQLDGARDTGEKGKERTEMELFFSPCYHQTC